MRVEFGNVFASEVEGLQEATRRRIGTVVQAVVDAKELSQVPNVKKLKGAINAYRIRVGDLRVGFFLEAGVVTFVRCLNRKDIYREFP